MGGPDKDCPGLIGQEGSREPVSSHGRFIQQVLRFALSITLSEPSDFV